MGPTSTVQPADAADHGEIAPASEPSAAMTPAGSEPGSRQCGRCRQFFPAEPLTSPPAKWWACPPCHRALFGTD